MENKWTPGQAINKGYPYNRCETEFLFPKRLSITKEENGQIIIDFSSSDYGVVEKTVEAERDFFMHRLFDYSMALEVAEDQIKNLLEEEPFIPEEFGFEIAHKPSSIHDSPVRVYTSKFNNEVMLYREVMDVTKADSFSPENWVLMRKDASGKFYETKVKLPCHRIAYCTFYSLSVQVEPNQMEAETVDFVETKPEEAMKLYDVTFQREDVQAVANEVLAYDEKDAMAKALFIFQTDDFYENMPEDIQFNEMKVELSQK